MVPFITPFSLSGFRLSLFSCFCKWVAELQGQLTGRHVLKVHCWKKCAACDCAVDVPRRIFGE